jgi:hypothetical protein
LYDVQELRKNFFAETRKQYTSAHHGIPAHFTKPHGLPKEGREQEFIAARQRSHSVAMQVAIQGAIVVAIVVLPRLKSRLPTLPWIFCFTVNILNFGTRHVSERGLRWRVYWKKSIRHFSSGGGVRQRWRSKTAVFVPDSPACGLLILMWLSVAGSARGAREECLTIKDQRSAIPPLNPPCWALLRVLPHGLY